MTITQQTSTVTIPATDAQSVLDTVYAQWEQLDARRIQIQEQVDRACPVYTPEAFRAAGIKYGEEIQQTHDLMRTLEDSIRILDDALSAARYAAEEAR